MEGTLHFINLFMKAQGLFFVGEGYFLYLVTVC